ncbi:MAG: CPBP family intramembrane metalloprotease [Peptostreptococcaceae bacterium]|nr:CPBP family intramembrane metalloprotease [Peptostreptococcaceae bacterium]
MKRLSISNVNLLYLFMALLLIILGSFVQSIDAESGLIATEFILVLLPAALFAIWTRGGMKKIFRLNRLSLSEGILIVSIIFLFYPISITGNMIVINLLDSIGWYRPIPFPSASNVNEYALLLFAVAISAGICEEFFFRGVVMRAYERYGPKKAIFWTAVLFGFFHFNIQNLLGPIMLGILFGYFVYVTDSIYAGVLAHATHNALSVTIGFLSVMNNNESPGAGAAAEGSVLIANVATIAIVILCAFVAGGLIRRLKRRSVEKLRMNNDVRLEEAHAEGDSTAMEPVPWWGYIPISIVGVVYVLFEMVSRR